jgi:hypothetical protein
MQVRRWIGTLDFGFLSPFGRWISIWALPPSLDNSPIVCVNITSMTRARFALFFCCLCGMAWLAGSTLHANPLKEPRRLIAGQTVDLDPLFRWWTNRHGDRPLRAWIHITGSVVATNGWGWTVEGTLNPAPPRSKASPRGGAPEGGRVKLALEHAPVSELESFSQLADELKALNDQSQVLSNQVKAAAQTLGAMGSAGHHSRVAAELRLVERQAKAQLSALRPLVADCRAKLAAFPDSKRYIVDCFALDMGQELNGLPVYDYGVR